MFRFILFLLLNIIGIGSYSQGNDTTYRNIILCKGINAYLIRGAWYPLPVYHYDVQTKTLYNIKNDTNYLRGAANINLCTGDSMLISNSYINNNGVYYDTLKTGEGCDSILQITISIIPKSDTTIYDTVCAGVVKYGKILTQDTTIEFHYNNHYGCDSTVYIYVKVHPIPNLSVCCDTIIYPEERLILHAYGCTNYNWNTGSTDSSITIYPNTSKQYTVSSTNIFNCTNSKKIDVTIKDYTKYLFLPTAFSPNNDGVNDFLKPLLGEKIMLLQFEIYNRWGQKMYVSNSNEDNGWDGNYQNENQPDGVYISYIKALDISTKKMVEKEQNITLIR